MKEENHAKDQAKAQLESIVAMVKALNVDYDRLEELKEVAVNTPSDMPDDDVQDLEYLIQQANGCESYDEAEQAIQEDPLSVQVRSGWYNPSEAKGTEPAEFEILLCTGGPAVRIVGYLDVALQPENARIEYQDWGTPWTEYYPTNSEALLEYCRQFYFGG